jgi:predicted hotdog family 3-hydroxylacyl-ACP dehydratase
MEELLEAVFFVQSAPRLYNEDQLPLVVSLELAARRFGCQPARTSAQKQRNSCHMFRDYRWDLDW